MVAGVINSFGRDGLEEVSLVGVAAVEVVVAVVAVSERGGEREAGDGCCSVSITTTSCARGWGSGTGSAAVQHSGELGHEVRGEMGGVGGIGGKSAGVSFSTWASGVILGTFW